MNSAQRQTLRQTLIDLGFERSSVTPIKDPEPRPGEYDESWINDNADLVEIKWAARTGDVIRQAALAFLHSEDPESISLKDLADALGVPHDEVEAITPVDLTPNPKENG